MSSAKSGRTIPRRPVPSAPARRRHPRRPCNLPVHITRRTSAQGPLAFEATVMSNELSVGGFFVESTFFLKPGTQVEVSFTLPEVGVEVRAAATVIRADRAESSSGFGVRFDGFMEDSEVFLQAYLSEDDLFGFVHKFVARELPGLSNPKRLKLFQMVGQWQMGREPTQENF